jgi:hypothetical protein
MARPAAIYVAVRATGTFILTSPRCTACSNASAAESTGDADDGGDGEEDVVVVVEAIVTRNNSVRKEDEQ